MTIVPINARYLALYTTMHRRLIKRLRDNGKASAIDLADLLESCSPNAPCRSGACPLCGGDFQVAAVNLVASTIRKDARALRGRMHMLTVVPGDGCITPNALTLDLVVRIKADIKSALAECGVPPGVFAIDISYNEDSLGRLPSHWCVHAHGNGLDWLSDGVFEALKERFPATKFVKRPVEWERLDNEVAGRLYAFKPTRVRRESYIVPAPADGNRGAYRDTRRRTLRPWQSVKLALIEHDLGFRGRMIVWKIDKHAVKAAFDAFERARDGPG